MENCVEDCKEILSQIKKQDKLLRLKRRWLMDLPLSATEKMLIKEFNPLKDKTIPEMLIREDDVYYDNVRSFVQRGFGVHNFVKEQHVQENVRSFDSHYLLNNLSSLLDKMTNKGLNCFAELLTDGLVEFEKTRWRMKKVIRKYLPPFLHQETHNSQMGMNQICHILNDPQYFHGNHDLDWAPTDYQSAAARVLDGLEELPVATLNAMYRKLNGQSGSIPVLGSYKSRQKQGLIGPVRQHCMKMLSELQEGEEPQELLVKALAVAGLTLKLVLGRPSVVEFRKFSPQIESLQNDIAKAICLINSGNRISIADIEALHKNLHHWADSKVEISKRHLRCAVLNLFTDFLFECGDMETIPGCLVQAVFDINKRFHDSTCRSTSKEEVEQEVEFLLCVSAQTKQIVWDLLPGQEVDQEFVNAYMEDLEETDDNDNKEGIDHSRRSKLHFDDFKGLPESFGEIDPFDFHSPISTGKRDGSPSLLSPNSQLNSELESVHITERDIFEPYDCVDYPSCPESKMLNRQSRKVNEHQSASPVKLELPYLHPFVSTVDQNGSSSPLFHGRRKRGHVVNDSARNAQYLHHGSLLRDTCILNHKQCKSANEYLFIQKACDEASMAVYRTIGGMLDEFAQAHHLHLRKNDLAYLRIHASDPTNSKGQ